MNGDSLGTGVATGVHHVPKPPVSRDALHLGACHPAISLAVVDPLPAPTPLGGQWGSVDLHGGGLCRLLYDGTRSWPSARTRQVVGRRPCQRAPADDISVGGRLLRGGLEVAVVVGGSEQSKISIHLKVLGQPEVSLG